MSNDIGQQMTSFNMADESDLWIEPRWLKGSPWYNDNRQQYTVHWNVSIVIIRAWQVTWPGNLMLKKSHTWADCGLAFFSCHDNSPRPINNERSTLFKSHHDFDTISDDDASSSFCSVQSCLHSPGNLELGQYKVVSHAQGILYASSQIGAAMLDSQLGRDLWRHARVKWEVFREGSAAVIWLV